jgi:putative membrane protein
MYGHMWGWDGAWGAGWGWFGLMHLVWWLLLIAGAVVLVRALAGSWRDRDSALQILRERYARGEIDRTEYEERRKLLKA